MLVDVARLLAARAYRAAPKGHLLLVRLDLVFSFSLVILLRDGALLLQKPDPIDKDT